MPWELIDDENDLELLRSRFFAAMQTTRDARQPRVIEVKTYRFYGFTIADAHAKKYRSPEEINWHVENRDTLKNWGDLLEKQGLPDKEAREKMKKEVRREANAAAEFAENAPPPKVGDLTRHVYWETDQAKRTSRGRLFLSKLRGKGRVKGGALVQLLQCACDSCLR